MTDLNLAERIVVRKEAMNYFKAILSHWSTYAAAIGVVYSFLKPSLDAYISSHPHALAAVLLGAAVAAYHATAPKDQQPTPPPSQTPVQ